MNTAAVYKALEAAEKALEAAKAAQASEEEIATAKAAFAAAYKAAREADIKEWNEIYDEMDALEKEEFLVRQYM